MTRDDFATLIYKLDAEGFDCAIENYADASSDDSTFNILVTSYLDAKTALEEYINDKVNDV